MSGGVTWTPPPVPPIVAPAGETVSVIDRLLVVNTSVAGTGVVRPFRRGATDILTGTGLAEVRASVTQVLGTRCSTATTQGEFPWNMALGSNLPRLRHSNNDAINQDLARTWVIQALATWIPVIIVRSVKVTARSVAGSTRKQVMVVRVIYDVLSAPGSNTVLHADVDQEVVI